MPQTNKGLTSASIGNMSVLNGDMIISPKPGSKFAAPDMVFV